MESLEGLQEAILQGDFGWNPRGFIESNLEDNHEGVLEGNRDEFLEVVLYRVTLRGL